MTFELYNIKRMLNRHGVETELFDVHAHIDRKLTMRENMTNIRSMVGLQRTEGSRIEHEKKHHTSTRGYRDPMYQIGKSNTEMDRDQKAKHPGYRHTKHGGYTERRKNRSDRPGSML